jgi:flagellar biogenesis protein FliO
VTSPPKPVELAPPGIGRAMTFALAVGLILLNIGVENSLAASAVPTDDQLESAPIGSDLPASSPGKSIATPLPTSGFDVPRVLLALAGVLSLIFLMRVAMRRFIPGSVVHRSTSAVKILARTSVAPRQHLLVIQFGKRLILVGDTGAHLNPLCEITDPDEIAGIVAHAREETMSVARRFESLFGRARKEFSDDRSETESFDASSEIRAPNPAIDETQKELAGLRDKVREVARQIGSA